MLNVVWYHPLTRSEFKACARPCPVRTSGWVSSEKRRDRWDKKSIQITRIKFININTIIIIK